MISVGHRRKKIQEKLVKIGPLTDNIIIIIIIMMMMMMMMMIMMMITIITIVILLLLLLCYSLLISICIAYIL